MEFKKEDGMDMQEGVMAGKECRYDLGDWNSTNTFYLLNTLPDSADVNFSLIYGESRRVHVSSPTLVRLQSLVSLFHLFFLGHSYGDWATCIISLRTILTDRTNVLLFLSLGEFFSEVKVKLSGRTLNGMT